MLFRSRIPDENECLEILTGHHILPNILEHSMQVKNVSLALVDNLKDRSIINRELVKAAALLHDISKTESIKSGQPNHDTMGGQILRDMGLDDIAEIIESHIVLHSFDPGSSLDEREIVHYADKRVLHSKIVTLDERIKDLSKRYSKSKWEETLIKKNREMVMCLEMKIQEFMKIDIEDALNGL